LELDQFQNQRTSLSRRLARATVRRRRCPAGSPRWPRRPPARWRCGSCDPSRAQHDALSPPHLCELARRRLCRMLREVARIGWSGARARFSPRARPPRRGARLPIICRLRPPPTSGDDLKLADLHDLQRAGRERLKQLLLGLAEVQPRLPVLSLQDDHLAGMNRGHVRAGRGR
jgi:hypothetical protein